MNYLLIILSFIFTNLSIAQRSISLTEAETLLQKNNLLILAEQFNISAAQASVIQAKIWEQPYMSMELNAINPQDNKFFDIGNSGQKVLAIQQLIYLGGKKKNEIAFAKTNIGLAEIRYEQLIRNLKFELSQSFYSIFFDQQKVRNLDNQIEKLDTLLENYTIQVAKGNIPLKEVVRLQSLVLNLQNERLIMLNQVIENQQKLALLTGSTENLNPFFKEEELINKYNNKLISKDSIKVYALKNNLEILSAAKISESQDLYLRWQKSLSVPDLTMGLSYDQRGGAFQNQVNLTFGIPLSLWNKNKGNIKIASAQLNQSNLNREFKKQEIATIVEKYWNMWEQQKLQLNSINKTITQNVEVVYEGMVHNFKKRNISMLEFTDFMESYNETSNRINEIKKAWILNSINLNYITNKEIF